MGLHLDERYVVTSGNALTLGRYSTSLLARRTQVAHINLYSNNYFVHIFVVGETLSTTTFPYALPKGH